MSSSFNVSESLRAARLRARTIVVAGLVVGALLAASVMAGPQLEHRWSTVSLGVSVGILMVVYLSLPSRLLGWMCAGRVATAWPRARSVPPCRRW